MNGDTRQAIEVAVVGSIVLVLLAASIVMMCACVQYDNSPDNTCRAADNFRKIPCDFYRRKTGG